MLFAQAGPPPPPPPPDVMISWFSVLALLVLALLVAVAFVAVVLVVYSTRRSTPPTFPPAHPADLSDEVARLRQRVEALQRDVDELRRQLPGGGFEARFTTRGPT